MLLAERKPASEADMAEVRLRLLGRSTQLHMLDVIPGGRAPESLLVLSCPVSVAVCSRETAASSTSECSPREKPERPPTVSRGRSMWVPRHSLLASPQEVRFYSQGCGPRASFHQTRSRQWSTNNGAQDLGMPLFSSPTAYYNILEISPNATQAQIKSAYYKQSFRFHPDRNSGDEDASRRFGQVTEAYHVLGSTSLRKKYDRGILSLQDVRTAKKPSGKSESPSRKEATSQRQASSTSSTPSKPMFDFDAFYQAHYGEQLAREQAWRARREELQKQKREKQTFVNQRSEMMGLVTVILVLPAVFLFLSFKN
ncbi:dnaJ homolog subfamily C member 30, mitochondrial [Hyperolius riggenbachi]|uniref:dnaJ homolog subfamily C member 30, mitochondrial n=1 Tax=Hyperolius riggenbachi TaxID=752182 RepID=UPI0035A34F32